MSALLSFPTVPLTVAMGVVFLYWLFVIGGAAGVDMLDGASEGVAGGMKGAGDAMAGAVKGAGEAVVGAMKGAGHAAAGGAKALGAKPAAPKPGILFGHVPVTVSLSVLVFFAWAFSLTGSTWLAPAQWLTKTAVLGGALLASLLCSSVVLRPLGKVFGSTPIRRRADLVGTLCVVTSTKVEAGFGTAEVTHTGATLNINVVCHNANSLKKGERALLIAYDESKDVFDVEPLDFLEPQELQALDDPDRARQVFAERIKLK